MDYQVLDHTADLALKITGRDLAGLFSNAGMALFDQITDLDRLQKKAHTDITIKGEDLEDLMVNWLRELLFLWAGRQKLVKAIEIRKISETALSARVHIDSFSLHGHAILTEIKAVTYHDIKVEQHSGSWSATVVFDI